MMYKHLSRKKLAEEILAETLGHYQEFSDEVNFFEKMLEMRKEGLGFDWVCDNGLGSNREDEVFFESCDFYMRAMDDMLQYYEDGFVGDDELDVISEIINWAIDNQEKRHVGEMLENVLTCLKEKNVYVDIEKGTVVKTMGEVIDTYLTFGFEGRHPEQMSKEQLRCDYGREKGVLFTDMELRSVSLFKTSFTEMEVESSIIKKDAVIEINFCNPLVNYNGRYSTLENLGRIIGFSADDYRVLITNGFSPKRALEICVLIATLFRDIIVKWNAWLFAEVQKFTQIKKLRKMNASENYSVASRNDDSSKGFYLNKKITDNRFAQYSSNEPRRYWVGDEIGTVKFWAQRKGVSTTWIRVRLQAGLSMQKIMEEVISGPPNWEMWKIQRPDKLHPDRKVITILDVMNKEQISKDEIVNAIGSGMFGKHDILKAIKRIKAKRRKAKVYGNEERR